MEGLSCKRAAGQWSRHGFPIASVLYTAKVLAQTGNQFQKGFEGHPGTWRRDKKA